VLADDMVRCAGFTAESAHSRCDRRFDCARFLARAGAQTPFTLSACEGGDRFIHAPTVAQQPAERHPYTVSSHRVLGANTPTPAEG
jgi:hypothetical protein